MPISLNVGSNTARNLSGPLARATNVARSKIAISDSGASRPEYLLDSAQLSGTSLKPVRSSSGSSRSFGYKAQYNFKTGLDSPGVSRGRGSVNRISSALDKAREVGKISSRASGFGGKKKTGAAAQIAAKHKPRSNLSGGIVDRPTKSVFLKGSKLDSII